MILLIILDILFSYFAGHEEAVRWKETNLIASGKDDRKLNLQWHLETDASYILCGLMFYLLAFTSLWILPFLLVLHWTISDGVMNLARDRKFFAVSLGPNGSTAPTEPYAQWYVKIPLLIITLIIGIISKF